MATRRLYKVTRENKKDETFAPQAQAILDAIRGSEQPVERTVLIEKLQKNLNTRQPVSRVLSFFRPRLISSGILKEIKETDPVEKPAKTAKTEKVARAASSEKSRKATKPEKTASKKTSKPKAKKTSPTVAQEVVPAE